MKDASNSCPPSLARIAVFGGILSKVRNHLGETGVCCYGGAQHTGNGELQRLVAALRAGGVSEVWILWRWSGHSAVARLIDVCRTLGVAYALVGSLSGVRKRLGAARAVVGVGRPPGRGNGDELHVPRPSRGPGRAADADPAAAGPARAPLRSPLPAHARRPRPSVAGRR